MIKGQRGITGMQRRGGESGGKEEAKGGEVSKYSRKTYMTPSHTVSSAAELIQSALMSNMIAWRAKCDHKRLRWTSIKQQGQKKYKIHPTQDI